ncbi:MAG TPA: hypothetical protein VFN65_09925 [Solirubrobacteraceae bacterium]|nr:hypothetical protein [Solirubrobacteraceae bacterium]
MTSSRLRFTHVAPGSGLAAPVRVTCPAGSPNSTATIHPTATLGPALVRESGTTIS